MAQTDLRKRSVQEKLNSMAIDVISVDMVTDAETIADNTLISQPTEIENAVAVAGGAAIIQSIIISNQDDTVDAGAIDVVFLDVDQALAGDEGGAINISDTYMPNILGVVTVSNWTTFVPTGNQVATKTNVGLAVKAAANSRSIYVGLINRSGANFTPWATSAVRIKIGLVKD